MAPKPVIFLHVPKTGGTTMNYILNDIYKWNFLWLRNDIIEQQSSQLNPIDLYNRISPRGQKQFKAFSGHKIAPLVDHLPPVYKSMILVRNPLQQIPSLYQHHLRNKSNTPSNIETRSHETLLDFVKSNSDFYPNPQVRSILNVDFEILKKPVLAREHIKSFVLNKVDLCGITEDFEDFLSLVSSSLNWKEFSFRVMNQRPDKGASIDQEVREQIYINNELDFYLYELVSDKFRSLQNQLSPTYNFNSCDSISFANKMINRIQQHRLAAMANVKLKREVHFKASLIKLFSK